MQPAQQRLEADDLPARYLHQGLVMQLELVACHGVVQFPLDALPIDHVLLHHGLEEREAARPSPFARYSARSALFISAPGSAPSIGASAMPMLTPTNTICPSMSYGALIAPINRV